MTFTDVLLSGIWFRNQTGSWKIQTKQNRASVKICPSQIAQPQSCAWIRTVNLLNIQKSEFIYTLCTCPWEPLKLEAALWSSWGNNTTNTAFICLFPYSNQTLKIVCWVRLGLCFRENGVDAAKRARQETLSSASFLAGAASRGWWPDVAEICKRCLTSGRSLPILRIAMLVYNQPCN